MLLLTDCPALITIYRNGARIVPAEIGIKTETQIGSPWGIVQLIEWIRLSHITDSGNFYRPEFTSSALTVQ